MQYETLNKLAQITEKLQKLNTSTQQEKDFIEEKLKEASLIIRLGETAHGLRHREVLAPRLCDTLEQFLTRFNAES